MTVPTELPPPSRFMEVEGLQLQEVGPTRVVGWIDLGPDHHQPYGIVHGGVYCTAVESAASIGAAMAVMGDGRVVVGVNNSTNFLRPMSEGRVQVVAEPIHQGRTQQLWNVRITDADDRLVATGQVRLQNLDGERFAR